MNSIKNNISNNQTENTPPKQIENTDNQSCVTFESLNEFRDYYAKNKERIDGYTTVVLNNMFKIKDYVIRKNYGTIGFRSTKAIPRSDIKNKKGLEDRVTQLEESVNQIINIINQQLGIQ